MYREQTSLIIELIRSSDVFNKDMSNGEKAQVWRNITEQCNAMPGVRERTVDQYKRHWYDLKMKVKNKILRRQEAYSVPGTKTIPEFMELTEEDLYVAKFVRNMDGMNDIIDEALQSVQVKAPRTRDQTAMLLKLVHTNKENFKKKDMTQRQNIWRDIAKILNQMNGPVKSVDGWKKAYWSWRLHAGDDYEKELECWIKKAPVIPENVSKTDDEEFITESLTEESLANEEYDDLIPSVEQEERFYELIIENKALIRTGSSDEPLKKQIWTNIANELNSIQGIVLSSDEWRKRANWGRLNSNHEKRKQLSLLNSSDVITFGTDHLNKVEFEIMSSEEMEHALQASNMTTASKHFENDDPDDFTYEEHNNEDLEELPDDYNSDQEFLYTPEAEEQEQQQPRKLKQQQQQQRRSTRDSTPVTDYDENPSEYRPQAKRLKYAPPIVKSFKFNNRIVHAVEKLSSDVNEIRDVLKQTSNSLACLEELMERQSEKQDETNALLKRNNQLLKILVEYKTGKRTNSSH